MKSFLYVRSDNNKIKSFNDIKTLAVVKSYGTIPKIKKRFPNIKIIQTNDILDSINMVLNKKVDVLYDSQLVVSQVMMQNLITGLKAIPQHIFPADKLYFFIAKDKLILLSIIQKALANITQEERIKIISKWLNTPNSVDLTSKEKKWLSKNINIRYAFESNWKPIEWADNIKEQQGILKDIINLVIQRTGVHITTEYAKSLKEIL